MNTVVDRLITERRADPEALMTKRDLLNYMLTGADKQTGERLDDVNIRHQILTFLIAGHETTSGLLSFAIYFLLKHPDVLARAYEEVDAVLGTDPDGIPVLAQVRKLGYVTQILKESLRLWPTAPAFSVYPREDTTIAGRYPVSQGENIMVLLPMLHRDRAVWGDDAEEFRPERFAADLEKRLPPHAFKPFGNGQRACIGQQFAMQEATLVLGMILRRFELIDHTGYQLHVKETLTIKPEGFTIKVRPRGRRGRVVAAPAAVEVSQAQTHDAALVSAPGGGGTPLLVLFGSNMGTAEGIAQRIVADGRAHGFAAKAGALDDYINKLPTEGAVVVVVSSYNGAPPDNAARFSAWIQRAETGSESSLSGVRYTVFGCGDHNWAATYQAIPKMIDKSLAARGASRVYERGEADAADDFDGQFQAWYRSFWSAIGKSLGFDIKPQAPVAAPRLRVEMLVACDEIPFASAFGAQRMAVVVNRELQVAEGTGGLERSTRHIELTLPEGVSYQAGDHLGVLPRNRPEVVARVLARFGLEGEALVLIRRVQAATTHLPVDVPIGLAHLLTNYVELQETATRGQLQLLIDRTPCPPERARLMALAGDDEASVKRYRDEILAKHVSLLEILEQCPSCAVAFDDYLGSLPALRPRYYSISSSPLVNQKVASITVGVVNAPARSGHGVYRGVASTFLSEVTPGGAVHAFVRGPGTPFRPPADPKVPMIMVGAGTGLAPFRGFLQERAALKEQGTDVGPSLLFFGCRHPGRDFLYEVELKQYEARGLTKLVCAFSRVEGQPKCYVQHTITANADAVWDLIEQGAVLYVCGDAARMAPDVRAAFVEVYRSKTGDDVVQAECWFNELRLSNRYVEDVWASG
jgi:cytochrome P450/NADPH-cytochrome P450 reductase